MQKLTSISQAFSVTFSQCHFPKKFDECDICFYFIFIKVIDEHSFKKSSQNSSKYMLKSVLIFTDLYLFINIKYL